MYLSTVKYILKTMRHCNGLIPKNFIITLIRKNKTQDYRINPRREIKRATVIDVKLFLRKKQLVVIQTEFEWKMVVTFKEAAFVLSEEYPGACVCVQ